MTTVLKIPGRNTAFAVEQYDLSNNFNEYKFKRDANLIDATGFGQRFSYDLAGVQKSLIDLKGFYTPGQGNIDNVMHVRFGQDPDVNIALAPQGWTALNPVLLLPTVIIKYDLHTKLKDAVMLDAEFATRGAVDNGFILSDPRVLTSGTSWTSSVLDQSLLFPSGTTAGATGQLHVMSVAGTTPSLSVKIQHCATSGGTYTDLFTFNAYTAAGCQRMTVDPGTTIQPFIKATATISGTTPVFGFMLGFARGVAYT